MAEKTVFMFPGQGSQYVGMREKMDLVQEDASKLFDKADEVLGYSITSLVDNGPKDELTRTDNAQPALLVTGLAAAQAMNKKGLHADIVLGHSLGQYTALVHAGALGFEDALRLVRLRGQLMDQANKKSPGGMAAVIGVKPDALKAAMAEVADQGVLEITNVNAPTQVVLSGENNAIAAITELLKERRMGRALPLNVSAPFHSSLMAPIADEFERALADVSFSSPKYAFIDNVTGKQEVSPEQIRKNLVTQLTSPVLWSAGIETAWELGGRSFVECGPKKVLFGLARRIVRGANLVASETELSA